MRIGLSFNFVNPPFKAILANDHFGLRFLDDLPGIVDSACLAVFVTGGSLEIFVPELGPYKLEAQSWLLLRDHGPRSKFFPSKDMSGAVLALDESFLKTSVGKTATCDRNPSRLDCLSCLNRNAAFVATGKIQHAMRGFLTQLGNPFHEPDACAICRRHAAAYALLGEIFAQLQRSEKKECQSCFTDKEKKQIKAIARYLEDNPGENHSLSSLSRRFYLNECKLKQGFKAIHGKTVFSYLREARMYRAAQLLKDGNWTVIAVANAVGYCNASHFARAFKSIYGCSPRDIARLQTGTAAVSGLPHNKIS